MIADVGTRYSLANKYHSSIEENLACNTIRLENGEFLLSSKSELGISLKEEI
ncbi:hypothetical protein [Acidianus manzaensis]|uniref:hypothetical protein n=1 Tax=Acidianus manzaensis TaxID=282676 RepID=UPI00164F52CB|nr:hypothetical protein [Acidianus manzaensis]